MTQHISTPLADLTPTAPHSVGHKGRDHVLEKIEQIAANQLADLVVKIDLEGYYPLDILKGLADAGIFSPFSDKENPDLVQAIKGLAAVSRVCGSTGFLVWCHMACALYLAAAPAAALHDALLTQHLNAEQFGGTALSNPIKALAGIEKIALHATRTAGGYNVNGTLPWVSHIAPGHYCGAVASLDGSSAEKVLFLLRFDKPDMLFKCPHFSGMEGTSTWGIRLENHFIPNQDVIAAPAGDLLQRIRIPFLLLQCGLAVGIIQGAIDSMRAVEGPLGHVNQYLEDRPDTVQSELDNLLNRVLTLTQKPQASDTDYLLNVLDAREQGSELALRAAQSALLHQGARGYISSAAPQRRMREAQFVAIVTPAIKHLRSEMAQLSREKLPL
ncbi:acyl-CoA dehydrogenase [Acetobacter indonesiensis NRIC 0313]|uniref:Acyl-CoA dehydrogenase n=1 Tax=Acetobacter indonesiensis TaxID=104101 RepID=A0A252ALJ9_9PROT|nr:acyl-CoA dehydrogenase family protein [Acetobacter indonesiensis]MCG0996020.1 acyl-CoA/acyl-ACP dehydrogenase [Acetobacter indonesiensis]OUI90550.1 acyl-CoA dehydrogenase [Acetobacter indonesiensis]GBQ55271.1 acyl-CoA dehydrogenase [Acetobacter indonesiensis NRIC 0313]